MNNENMNTNEKTTAQDIVKAMDKDGNAAMEKNMKLAFIFLLLL
ncbi:hypothetical protein CIY_00810 [Butyrivibrio fibrisolvens 16/4]|nr:hypothetical protein CIY_00810 [Butyrivibrio fibrisolvens 16/4]